MDEKPHFTIIWTIENFSIPCCVISPSFTVKEMEMTKWHLYIECGISGYARLGIKREPEDDGPESVEIKYELSFLGIDGLPLYKAVDTDKFENKDLYDIINDVNAVFLRRRAELLPKDKLTVRCRMRRTGTEISKPDLCVAHTLLRADRRIFVWAIRDFSFLQRDQSKKFLLNPNSTEIITISFIITENDGEEYGYIDIQNSSSNEISSIEICLLDFEGTVKHSEQKVKIGREGTLFKNFLKTRVLAEDKMSLVPNDVLSLRFEIEMNAKVVWSRIENYRYLKTTNLGVIATDAGEILRCEQDETVSSSFTQDMKSLFEKGNSSDFSLQAGGQSFPVHKYILSARSAVFRAMFNTDMLEKTSKCVPIPDLTADTLRELLSYIYTGKVKELQWEDAADLYTAADKYELLELKKKCATVLKSSLSVSNFSVILTVADMHQDKELEETAQDFLMRQDEDFFSSDKWRSFREKNPVLAWEIVDRMLCNMRRRNGKRLRWF